MVSKEERGVLGFDEVGSLIILTGALAVSSGFRIVAGKGIPSAQRLVWAAKQALGNAALGALFA